MKVALLPLGLLLALQACHKPDEATPAPNPITDKIKTVQITPVDTTQAWQTVTYRFTYTSAGLVDTMQLLANSGLANTIVYERHPDYFVRRWYNGPSLTPDPVVDSFTTEPDGRPGFRNAGYPGTGISMQTAFTYNGDRQLTNWQTTLGGLPGSQGHTLSWTSGNVTNVEGVGGDAATGEIVGTYTYDASKGGQPAHPLTFYALCEWGQPLVQCAQTIATHDISGTPALQNVTWSGNRIASYEALAEQGQKSRFTFTYY